MAQDAVITIACSSLRTECQQMYVTGPGAG